MDNPYKIKSLNFSYNSLYFSEQIEKIEKGKTIKPQ